MRYLTGPSAQSTNFGETFATADVEITKARMAHIETVFIVDRSGNALCQKNGAAVAAP
jgi:hypothetical protein